MINFIKVVRVAKVVAHTTQIEKKIDERNLKIGMNMDTGSAHKMLKKRAIRIKPDFNLNEITIFLKYQSNFFIHIIIYLLNKILK